MIRTLISKRQLLLLSATFVSIFVVVTITDRHQNAKRTEVPTKPTQVPSTTSASLSASRFVSLCPGRTAGNHRTGNHLFMFAAMMYVADRTNREVIMKPNGWCLDDVFQLVVRRFNGSNPPNPVRVLHPPGIYNGDPLFDNVETLQRNLTEQTLALCGLYQTYRYADALGPRLRQMLQMKPDARHEADLFFEVNRSANWKTGSYFRVGIHVRRGDFLSASEKAWGLTVVTEQYLNNSMNYFMTRHARVQFIIATDDLHWTRNALINLFVGGNSTVEDSLELYRHFVISNTSVATFSVGHSTAADLAILTACDASIISTGSYSWWAGWLTNKTTIYYSNWPRSGTTFASQLNGATYFPDRWIPMT